MSRPALQPLSKTAAVILTIAGLIFLPIQVADYLGSTLAALATAGVLTLVLAGGAAVHFLPSQLYRHRFGIAPYRTPAILARATHTVRIDREYRGTLERLQTLIFLDQPSEDELIDVIDVFPHEDVDETAYSSEDSIVADVIRRSPSALAVHWRPKSPITPFVPYQHHTFYKVPSLYGEDAFYQATYMDRQTGVKEWYFESKLPIEYAIAFIMPRLRTRVREQDLYRRLLKPSPRGCEQPVIEQNGHRISWILKRPKRNRTYVLFAIYQGKLEHALELSRGYNRNWWRRLSRDSTTVEGIGAP